MHAMLMTGAFHLHRLNPTSSKRYGLQAAYHLQQSLRSFRKALSGSILSVSNNIDAIIGTAILLIVHGYSSPEFSKELSASNSDSLLPHSSGVFDIVRRTRQYAISSIFQPFCTPKLLPYVVPSSGPALNLMLMVNTQLPNYGSTDANSKIYIAIIKSLTLVLEAITSHTVLGGTPPDSLLTYLVQWLSFLPPEFVILIDEHDEKALIIMAYYYSAVAFVLSKARGSWWWMRERPMYMVSQIAASLDEKWIMWMRWPLEMLEKFQNGTDSPVISPDNIPQPVEVNSSGIAELGILSNIELHFKKISIEE